MEKDFDRGAGAFKQLAPAVEVMSTAVSRFRFLFVHSSSSSHDFRYSEATPLLYSANTFCFQDIATLRYFVRTVLPHRRNQIKAIQLPWMKTYLGFPQPNGELSHVWEALEQMPNLQVIHIVRLTTRQGSPCDWSYPVWTYWIAQLKSKCDVQIVGA